MRQPGGIGAWNTFQVDRSAAVALLILLTRRSFIVAGRATLQCGPPLSARSRAGQRSPGRTSRPLDSVHLAVRCAQPRCGRSSFSTLTKILQVIEATAHVKYAVSPRKLRESTKQSLPTTPRSMRASFKPFACSSAEIVVSPNTKLVDDRHRMGNSISELVQEKWPKN